MVRVIIGVYPVVGVLALDDELVDEYCKGKKVVLLCTQLLVEIYALHRWGSVLWSADVGVEIYRTFVVVDLE